MKNRFLGPINGRLVGAVIAAAVSAVISVSVTRTAGQAHAARPGMVMQDGVYPYEYAKVPAAPVVALGAAGGVPGSIGVVGDDGRIPYTPEAAAIKQENSENWIDRDPELKCYLPGIPESSPFLVETLYGS